MKTLIIMIVFFAMSLVSHAQDLTGQITIIWNKDATQADKNKIKEDNHLTENKSVDPIHLESLFVSEGDNPQDVADKLSHEAAVNSATPGGMMSPEEAMQASQDQPQYEAPPDVDMPPMSAEEPKVCHRYNKETDTLEIEPCKLENNEAANFSTPPPDSIYKCYYHIVAHYNPETKTYTESKEPCYPGGVIEEPEGEKP